MTVQELQLKLDAAEAKLNKAQQLLQKYIIKSNELEVKYSEVLINYPLNDNSWVAANWDKIPYDIYNLSHKYEDSKECVKDSERKVKELTQVRDNWKTKLELMKAKENEFAQIPQVVKDFVHNWRVKTEAWIKENLASYNKARRDAYKIYEKACDYSNDLTYDERKVLINEYNDLYSEIRKTTDPFILTIASRGGDKDQEEFIQKTLDEEERDKIFDLIRRVTKITGTITDASMLRIGEQNGELNGLVEGQDGKAFVETIGAGGYAIQRFHYRVLVKPIK